MAEEPGTPDPEPTPGEPKGEPKTFTQDQVNDLIAREKGKIQAKYEGVDIAQLRADAEELAEIKEKGASELEKAQGKLSKAEKERDEARALLLRFEVAKDKEIPAEAVDLLSGTSREELEASADKILSLVKSRSETEPKPDFDGGAREPAEDPKTPEEAHTEAILGLLGVRPNN